MPPSPADKPSAGAASTPIPPIKPAEATPNSSSDAAKTPTQTTGSIKPVEAKTKKTLGYIVEREGGKDIPNDVAPASRDENQIASAAGNTTLDDKPKAIAAGKRSAEADSKEDENPSPPKRARSDNPSMESDGVRGDHAEVPTCAVRDLNPDLRTPWVFVGRILARNPIRSFSTWRGKSRLFEVYVSDEDRAIIRATVFNDGVDKFYETVVPGTICSFSAGRVKTTNSAFVLPNSPVELSFGADANIVQLHDNTVVFPEPVFQHTPLNDLPAQDPTETPTVHGVIVDIGPQRPITRRKRTETHKREFLLVDDSDAEILCTAWGQTATEIDIALKGHVILVTAAKFRTTWACAP
ncbi:hypothetical protein PF005_g4692 [Phytophthora fragariae]|uniref:Replication protein A OB domain-containing protein n=1 Tax=Phytophthora fragariae TaxID=53985 RepID=A0A6A3T410_9STRA|nr:hypothetical protein PF003_g38844 [Phytophthora fragariae]KAE8948175.1 hypothetical protein PF009_g2248 [Phytophthora fragariae]KAE8998598.1 hypothetical protein PF011_g14982 [Phytophthora fragariae]KAE9129658.1 hypothetical protein PF007_g4809 [Phytophthora fragariae]KAE9131056.1 hypothetical protein PF010_g3631 [Phytophthora fragariae]